MLHAKKKSQAAMVPGSEEGESSGSLASILNLNTEVGLNEIFDQVKNNSKER